MQLGRNLILLAFLLFILGSPFGFGAVPKINWSPLSSEGGGARGAVQLASGEILATRTDWGSDDLRVICSRSQDGGKTWADLAVIVQERKPGDIGDGHLLQLPNGDVLYGYRHHVYGEGDAVKSYSIRVAVSYDRGKTWQPHSTVAASSLDPAQEPGAFRGLWSSFLLLKRDGTLHCVFDDEDTPQDEGFFRHQWLTLKTWDEKEKQWKNPMTVSRAHQSEHLSRDGMPSLVELSDGRLVCAFESVQVAPPHANCLRSVTSDDGGKTWSWQREERSILFESARQPNALAISPWMTRLPSGELICLFATDEDRETPGISGTPPAQLSLDVKSVISTDGGETWSRPAATVYTGDHRNYLPGILVLEDGNLLTTFFDFSGRKHRAMLGAIGSK